MKTRFASLFAAVLFAGPVSGQEEAPSGAESPQELLQRVATGIEKKNLAQLTTCIAAKTEAEKKAAEAGAKLLLLQPEVHAFVKEGSQQFGDTGFIRVMGGTINVLASLGSPDYAKLAKSAEIEFPAEGDYAVATTGRGPGSHSIELRVVENRWFLNADPSINADGTPANQIRFEAASEFLEKCRKALKEAKDAEEFSEQVGQAFLAMQEAISLIE